MSLSRREFIKTCGRIGVVSLAASGGLFAKETARRPNVLFIAVDDLKPILGCYGDRQVKSPNIDRLAENGFVFLNNHCQVAVCGPTRASLLTGLRPDTTKVWDLKTRMRDIDPDILTLPQHFKQNGYTTVGMGKIFDYRCCDGMGTQDKASWSRPFVYVPENKYASEGKITSNPTEEDRVRNNKPSTECIDVPDTDYFDGKLTVAAVDNLKILVEGNKPFFLAVGFKKPHLPFTAPKKYWDLYKREDFKVHPFQQFSKNGPELAYHKSSELRNGYTDVPLAGPFSEDKQLEMIHGYYACVSFVDAQVGKLLDEVKEQGIADDTIVVLWGDHGWHLGDHGLWCKHTNFEQSTRSPLIFSTPNRKYRGKSQSPTEFVDIFPTLCDLAGLDTPTQLEGTTLEPILDDPKASVKKAAVSQFQRGSGVMGYAYRDRRYRYIIWQEKKFYEGQTDGPIIARELYDYQTDPMETVNVVDDPEYRKVVRRFEKIVNNI